MPRIVVHLHFHQHVAGEELAFGDALLAALHLDDFFDRHQNLAKQILHARTRNTLLERALNRLLEARIGVNHIPTLAHDFFQPRIRS
jgi:hypothetical protein